MKTLLTILFIATIIHAEEDPKKEPSTPVTKSIDKGLDELTQVKLQRIESDQKLLDEHFHIAEYSQALQALMKERNDLIYAKCTEVGATEKDAEANRCGVDWKTKYKEPEFKFGKVIFIPATTPPSAPPASAPGKPK